MEQTLADRVEISSGQLYEELRDPSIRLLVLGEQHTNGVFLQNQLKILKDLHAHKRDYQLAVEYFDSTDDKLFHDFWVKNDRTGLVNKIRTDYVDTHSLIDPTLEFSFDAGKRIIPVSFSESGNCNYDYEEKETHIAERLNEHLSECPKDRLTVLLIGSIHILDKHNLIPNIISLPKERSLVIQHPDFPKKILKVLNNKERKYEVGKEL